MNFFFKNLPAVYQFVIEVVLIIIGAGIALPGGKKWGWLIFILGIIGILFTIKMRILTQM